MRTGSTVVPELMILPIGSGKTDPLNCMISRPMSDSTVGGRSSRGPQTSATSSRSDT